jgi:hypothetical protein
MVLQQEEPRHRGVDDHEQRARGHAPSGHGRRQDGGAPRRGGVGRNFTAPETKHH